MGWFRGENPTIFGNTHIFGGETLIPDTQIEDFVYLKNVSWNLDSLLVLGLQPPTEL